MCQQTTTSCKRWPVTNGMDHRTVKYKNYEDIKQYTIFTIARWTHYPWIILRSQIQKCVFSSVNYLIFNHKTFRWLVYTTTRQLYWQSRVQYPIKKNCAFNFLHYGFCSPIFTIFFTMTIRNEQRTYLHFGGHFSRWTWISWCLHSGFYWS